MNEHILILKGYIEHLEYMKERADEFFDREQADKDIEAFTAAIKALEQEPKIVNLGDNIVYGTDGNLYKITVSSGKEYEQEPCEDAISRQAVLTLAKEECDTAIIPYRKFVKDVNALPPVNPQPK